MTKRTASLLVIVAALVTLGIAVQQRYRVNLKLQDPAGGHINDFDRWMIMTPRFVDEHADYVDDQLPTPPISLLILSPLARLARPDAQFVWVCVKLPLAGLVLALVLGLVRRSGARLSGAAAALIAAGWWLPVVLDMQEGQMNLVVLLPLVAALYLAQEESFWWDVIAGLLLGLAVAVKVTPAIFAAYFLWQRRSAVALAAVAGVVMWSVPLPAMVFGWEQTVRWLGQWTGIMIVPYVTHGTVAYAMSQSFGSFALRLLSAVPAFASNHHGVVEPHYMNLVALAPSAVFLVVRGIMLAVGAGGLCWTRRRLETLRSERYLLEIGAVAAFMLWFSERTWVHHYVSFIFTLAAAGAVMSDATQSALTRRAARTALAVFAVATLFASEAGRLLGPDGVDWAKSAGVFLWPSVMVTIAATSRWQSQRRLEWSASRLPGFRYRSSHSSG